MEKQKGQFPAFILFISGLLLLIPNLLIHILFFIANRKKVAPSSGEYYSWRMGQIYYTCEGFGEPLLLIHSTYPGASHMEWQKSIEQLAQSYTVYTIDLLGYGRSDKPNTVYTGYLYVSLLNDFIRDIIQKPAYAAGSGHSADFAVMACRMEPKNFKKLILISPYGISAPPPTDENKKQRILYESPIVGTLLYRNAVSKSALRSYMGKVLLFSKEKGLPDFLTRLYHSAHAGGPAGRFSFASCQAGYMNLDIKQAVKKIAKPLYFIWGENHTEIASSDRIVLEKIKPSAQQAIFEQTRALPHFENSSSFHSLLKSFFQ